MQITSCSLACSGGAGGTQIACGLNQVAVNEALVISFSQPVNLATVNKNTFQVTDLGTGKSPAGSFTLDPSDPKNLIFRPLLTFDASGAPVFGFSENKSYQVLLRGTVQDSGGNFIASTSGKKNVSRMFCTIVATGILDPVPGAPSVDVSVDVVTEKDPVTGEVTAVEKFSANSGTLLTDVWSDSRITMTFDDVMNPATLVNPVTKESSTLHVYVDPDGNTNDPSDQVEVFGDYTINIDQDALKTVVVFTPSGGLPSSGSGLVPRKIILDIPSVVSDLGSNSLVNPGEVIFVPQFVPFDPVILPDGVGEQFITTKYRDTNRTGATWADGALLRGLGGGSGMLGDLIVSQEDSPVTLDTDSQVFSSFDVIPQGSVAFPPSATPPSVTITDGVFEFATIDVLPGAQLRFTGSKPARLFARGGAFVQSSGRIDASGATPPAQFTTPTGHDSSLLDGGLGGAGGPAAGSGGQGGDRPNDTDPSLLALLGSPNPGADIDGQDATGVGGTGTLGSGLGGTAWPTSAPSTSSDLGMFLPDKVCKVDMVAGPGSGGAYGTSGSPGVPVIVDGLLNPSPPTGVVAPDTPGGDAATIGLTPEIRTLNPDLGHLRGGSGGGGGGTSWLRSQSDGFPFGECVIGKKFKVYTPHSGAGGGGGGGALQLQAGELIKVDGNILAKGGNGGDGQDAFASIDRQDQACPGGGGSGGALLLQARNLIITDTSERLNVSGGAGGIGAGGAPGTKGGVGGAGLVRLESQSVPDPLVEAKKIAPFNAAPGSVTGGPTSTAILSTGPMLQGFMGPQGRSGAQSCWIIPDGNFFVLDFTEDDLSDPLDPVYGWDFDVVTTLGLQPFSFRNPTDPANPFGISPESALGSDLGGATPGTIVVRFQGVHSIKEVLDVCNVDLNDPLGSVDVTSLTPWVRHPAELNDYWDLALPGQPELAAKRRPNMIRYQIIFDGSTPLSGLVAGLTNFHMKASPD
ncbi:MAG: Ig-like domain-containing protein [Planctomycetota bacterium]|nr:Ig-like domain-containing protein [Planctomycetota bacterium]